ncbi:MAG: type II toxin-antitoxin system HicB family antitoxin [Planctomycetota bacterium]
MIKTKNHVSRSRFNGAAQQLYLFPMVVEYLVEGGYFAECPILSGCHVEGATYAEAVENLESAIKTILKSYKELGKKIPDVPVIKRTTVVSAGILVMSEN